MKAIDDEILYFSDLERSKNLLIRNLEAMLSALKGHKEGIMCEESLLPFCSACFKDNVGGVVKGIDRIEDFLRMYPYVWDLVKDVESDSKE